MAANPADHDTLYRLSSIRLLLSAIYREEGSRGGQGDAAALSAVNLNLALDAITHALALQPVADPYWSHFTECASQARLTHPLDPRARDVMAQALEHPSTRPLALAGPILSLVQSRPAALAVENIPDAALDVDGNPGDSARMREYLSDLFGEPLLLRLLQLTVVPDASLERWIRLARKLALREALEQAGPGLPLTALAAIAQQCFATEYVYAPASWEPDAMEKLVQSIESALAGGIRIPLHQIATAACYRPLHELKGAERLGGILQGTLLQDLHGGQVLAPEEERRLRATIAADAGSGDNAVSAAVGSLYETHPYPRWLKAVRTPAAGALRDHLRGLIPHSLPLADDATPSILVAGCGTGLQSIETAQRYPDARVLAIDLSATSLAYAMRKTRELGLGNVEYRQCDILELASLPDRFDYIESIGVLHHMEDPLRGWRSLAGLLKPVGIMRIGLYSEIARRELDPYIALVADRNLSPDLEGIRRCREVVRETFGASHLLAASPDFYCASGCRDMLFHVMEHRYTLPQIGAMAAQLNLEFLGLHLPGIEIADRYLAAFPDDPGMRNLDNWHRFETANPWLFRGLCRFWVQARR